MVQKAYKFRLYPNKEQREYFAKTFGCVRFVYNRMLAEKIAYYDETVNLCLLLLQSINRNFHG